MPVTLEAWSIVNKLICYWFDIDLFIIFSRAVSSVLTNLKDIAGDMGSELDRQNHQLDRLNNKMDVNTVHLEQANYRIRRQL